MNASEKICRFCRLACVGSQSVNFGGRRAPPLRGSYGGSGGRRGGHGGFLRSQLLGLEIELKSGDLLGKMGYELHVLLLIRRVFRLNVGGYFLDHLKIDFSLFTNQVRVMNADVRLRLHFSTIRHNQALLDSHHCSPRVSSLGSWPYWQQGH